ncbi:chromatin remodeling protein EBS-like isoform X1 [Primulina tabacum]|uniref:chromatin remodeling protein EBS-like isoform X1 n=1 Tax=Primulina tabacum TaxID=48773 RepID=UPI003F59BB80
MVLWLSQYIKTRSCVIQNSHFISLIQIDSLMASVTTIYSASVVDKSTTGWRVAFQHIAVSNIVKMKQVVDFPVSKFPAKSESTNPRTAGDCVLMRPSDLDKPPYVARVEKIEADHRNNVKVHVQWYYRPEESIGGRRQFHGAKELFLSDHFDVQSAHTIEGRCTVHTFKNYTKLENVGAEDYFCRFDYKAATGGFTPDRVAVYCKCEMPYNPDDLMVQCEGCKDWFHPSCMRMTIEDAKKLDHFLCSDCSSDDDTKRSLNSFPVSPPADAKVELKRRKR